MDTTRARQPAERRHDRAFTLIEMLVVMAIIALLLGILIPSIGAVRRRGAAAVCMAQLAQYGRANHLYADTNHGLFVPISVGPDLADPWFGNYRYRTILGLANDSAAASDGETNGGWDLSLGDLGCPSTPAELRDKGDHHYGMNLNYETPDERGELLVVKRSEVVRPSEKVQMTDASSYAVWAYIASPQQWDDYGEETPGVAYRHDRTANVLHFDGHVDTYTPETLYFPTPREFDRLWNILR